MEPDSAAPGTATPGEATARTANAEVLVLGSAGGPTPKPGRRPVSHAVRIDDEVTLVDCGNGTAGQYAEAGLPFRELRRILISHHHIDHVADAAMLVHLAWSQLAGPVHVIGPPPLKQIFELHYQAFDVDIAARMADEGRRHLRDFVRITEIDTDAVLQDGSATIRAALVDHPPVRHAFGYRIDQGGISVCCSGDTAPSEAVAALARGAELLIHETTYLADAHEHLSPERAAKVLPRMRSVHSDPAGAGRIAASAEVASLLLSPVGTFGAAPDEVILAEAATEYRGQTWVGRDFLRIDIPNREEI